MPEPELFEAPADLTLVSPAELIELETQAVAAFDAVMSRDQHTTDDISYSERLAGDLDRIRAELRVRATREAEASTLAQQEQQRRMSALSERVHGSEEGGQAAAAAVSSTDLTAEAIAQATAQGVALALFGDDQNKLARAQERFASLSATARQAPDPKVPERPVNAVTASIDIPGIAHGSSLPDIAALGEAFQRKVKAIPVTRDGKGAPRHLVASVKNTFEHTVDERTNPAVIEELWHSMTDGGGGTAEALVAGGGWCAPSEIKYDFFNIASAAPKMIDLPTVGVSRGGIRFPVSPAIGDVFFQAGGSNPASGFGGFAFTFANTSDPWLWSESDDILTVTGSVNKPTLRVPCPSFSETRLECYGISLTAGNLTDDAYPESTQNFIRLLRAAYAHVINARLIGLMVTASGSSSGTLGTANNGLVPALPNAIALAATDYRNRYAMDEDAVLEVVLPFWILEMMRSDVGYKPGLADLGLAAVVDAQLIGLFTSRNVRPQFVSDWQVRGSAQDHLGAATPATAWPTTVEFMLYAAGTFLHGTGLQLDLGVIRDSVLNAENDYTALWAEECHLISQVGHASRIYTVNLGVSGATGLGIAGAKV